MIRIDGTLECEWCNSPALWGADTPRGHRDLCQRHYDDLVRERASGIGYGLSDDALALVRECRGMVTGCLA